MTEREYRRLRAVLIGKNGDTGSCHHLCKPAKEDGLCSMCGKFVKCRSTNVGWVCERCFSEALVSADPNSKGHDPGKFPCRIVQIPCPHRAVYCLMEGAERGFITCKGVLYCFENSKDATVLHKKLGAAGCDLSGIKIVKVKAVTAVAYVLATPNLMLIPVAEIGEWV